MFTGGFVNLLEVSDDKETILRESDIYEELVEIGNDYASNLGITNFKWERFDLPTMGNDKLSKNKKAKLVISENKFLFIE